MSKKQRSVAHAPYNFVPLPEKIITRYKSLDDLPTHDVRRKEEKDLLSGEITFDIVAESPILVADGTDRENENAPRTFVKNAQNVYEIPGSTLRGLLRSTVSVLSLSNWTKWIDEETFYYRTVGESRGELAKTYRETLNIRVEQVNGKQISVAQDVKAGYIVRTDTNKYVIHPAMTDGGRHGKSYYKYHQRDVAHSESHRFKSNLRNGFIEENVSFSVNQHGKVVKLNSNEAKYKGKLLFTGPMWKKNTAYVINEIDSEATPIAISEQDLKAYKSDYYFRSTKFGNSADGKRKKDFFSLPSENGIKGAKPCFYIEKDGKLFFGYTAYLRLKYDHATSDALPNYLKDEAGIDYTAALFGFTGKEGNYASRLNFFSSYVKGLPQPLDPIKVISGSPRASALTMYLEQNLGKREYNSYNDENASLRGMKHYWIKERTDKHNSVEKEKVASTLEFLPTNTTFTARISFEQLHKDELGLLLWAIQAPSYHQLGMGKPFGYGVVSFSNIECNVVNVTSMYDNLTDYFNMELIKYPIQDWIENYHTYVKTNHNIELQNMNSVSTFFKLKEKSQLPEEEMTYMDLNHYRKKPILPTTNDLMNGEYKKYLNSNEKHFWKAQGRISESKNKSKSKSSKREYVGNRNQRSNDRGFHNRGLQDLARMMEEKRKKK